MNATKKNLVAWKRARSKRIDDYYLYDGVMKVHFTENICHLYTTTILLGILCSYAIACSVSVVSHIHVGHRLDNIFFFFSILSCVSCYILFCPGDFNTRNLPVLVSRWAVAKGKKRLGTTGNAEICVHVLTGAFQFIHRDSLNSFGFYRFSFFFSSLSYTTIELSINL